MYSHSQKNYLQYVFIYLCMTDDGVAIGDFALHQNSLIWIVYVGELINFFFISSLCFCLMSLEQCSFVALEMLLWYPSITRINEIIWVIFVWWKHESMYNTYLLCSFFCDLFVNRETSASEEILIHNGNLAS